MNKISRGRLVERVALGVFRLDFMLSFLRSETRLRGSVALPRRWNDRLLREMADEIDELEDVLEQLQADETQSLKALATSVSPR